MVKCSWWLIWFLAIQGVAEGSKRPVVLARQSDRVDQSRRQRESRRRLLRQCLYRSLPQDGHCTYREWYARSGEHLEGGYPQHHSGQRHWGQVLKSVEILLEASPLKARVGRHQVSSSSS